MNVDFFVLPTGDQVVQWLAHRIVVLMMKIAGGSNATVVGGLNPTVSLLEVPDGCLRLLRSDRPNTAAHGYMGPHHMHTWGTIHAADVISDRSLSALY
jgi:hypothetical protein